MLTPRGGPIYGARCCDTIEPKTDMPNQRKKGKKMIGLWVDERERAVIGDLMKRWSCSKTSLIKRLIQIASGGSEVK